MKFIIALIFIFVSNISCQKNEVQNQKFKLIVKYFGLMESRTSCFPPTGNTYDSSRINVEVVYGSTDTTTNILGNEVKLDEDGSYSSRNLSIKIIKDSLSFARYDGTPACHTVTTFHGTKIK